MARSGVGLVEWLAIGLNASNLLVNGGVARPARLASGRRDCLVVARNGAGELRGVVGHSRGLVGT